MPFTPSHVLAVVPALRWRRLDPTCLVIGSMAPDFEYFARGKEAGTFSHSMLGIVAFAIPVTLLVALVYDRVIKWPALLVAPRALTPVFAPPWRPHWLVAIVSAAIGDVTHLLWDSCTHGNGLFTRSFAPLRVVYEVPVVDHMAMHRILQYVSSVVGLAGVGIYVLWLVRRAPPNPVAVPRARARIAFALCLAVGGTLTLLRLVHRHNDPGNLVVGAISGMLAGTLFASILVRSEARAYRDAWRDLR